MHLARFALACAAASAATWAVAAGMEFSSGLSPTERVAAGIPKLNPVQLSALDALVAHDVALAHEGGVTGFSSEFSARHTEQERISAGMSLLSDKERLALDRYVSRTIALGPPPDEEFSYSNPEHPPTPPPTPAQTSAPRPLEIHGDVSFTVGGSSHGGNFYGTSVDAFVTDPNHGFTVGVGFSEFRGKGLIALCAPYGPYGPYDPYGPYVPFYDGPPN